MTSVPSRKNRTALVLLTHRMDRSIRQLIAELRGQCTNCYDFFVLADNTKGLFDRFKAEQSWHLFSKSDLATLGYPKKVGMLFGGDGSQTPHHRHFNFPPGFTDLPLLHFFRSYPDYDYYWVVEYDVRFSGDWREFFEELDESQSDLLCTTLTRGSELPELVSLVNIGAWPTGRSAISRGFFPGLSNV